MSEQLYQSYKQHPVLGFWWGRRSWHYWGEVILWGMSINEVMENLHC